MRLLRRIVPDRAQDAVRVALGRVDVRALPWIDAPADAWKPGAYEDLYERHAHELPPMLSIGDGDYEHIGRVELGALIAAGLEPQHTLVDFGCGAGRLAQFAVPKLSRGAYIGIDISQTMLAQAQAQVSRLKLSKGGSTCRVSWKHQTGFAFDLPPASVDFFAAYSVFTHMEHEDAYRYLVEAHRVAKPGGSFVFSCLTLDVPAVRSIFLKSAALTLEERWGTVRNVATTRDHMTTISAMAGWTAERWYKGDERNIPLGGGQTEMAALGQSVCVLRA